MFRVILVRVGAVSEIKEYSTFRKVQADIRIGADDEWETFELEGIEGVGIVAGDQDLEHLKSNRLGIRGDFIIIGMRRDGKGGHIFSALEEEQARDLKLSLSITIYKNAIAALNEGEIDDDET
jgi:hypothetical protein